VPERRRWDEVASLEQQRLAGVLGERIGEAVTEVEPGGMAAALPKSRYAARAIRAWCSVTGATMILATSRSTSNRRLATGSRLPSMTTAASSEALLCYLARTIAARIVGLGGYL
jgi:hypothetical protein